MTPPDSAPSARREPSGAPVGAQSVPETAIVLPASIQPDPTPERAPGWYVVNDNDNGTVFNGPYQHLETASVKRDDRERRATDDQSERWNLSIRWFGDKSKKIMPSRYDICVNALRGVSDPAAMLETAKIALEMAIGAIDDLAETDSAVLRDTQNILEYATASKAKLRAALALLPPIRISGDASDTPAEPGNHTA